MTEPKSEIKLIIPMIPEMELMASTMAEAVAGFMKLDPDTVDEIKLAIIEACINAIGHSTSEDQCVSVNFEIQEDSLTIQISDFGQGFDVGPVRQELDKRHQDGQRKRGWGLKIMEELMDEVHVESGEQGTKITMVKRRPEGETG